MGIYYEVYAEVRYKGQWYNLNPMMKKKDGTYNLRPIFWGQSVFSPIHDTIEDEAILRGIPDDMSPELRAEFRENLDDPYEAWFKECTYREMYKQYMYAVNYGRSFRNRVKKDRPYKYRGYVSRESIASFEIGEIEELTPWLTIEEYKQATPEEKEDLVYYEWNNVWDEYAIYNIIVSRISAMLAWWGEGDATEDGWCEENITDGDIRVFIRWG